jgi:hypothetical protein
MTTHNQWKQRRNDCTTCDGKKSKKAYTCMKCFKLGKRKRNPINNGEKSLRNDLELQKKMRKRLDEIQKEQSSEERASRIWGRPTEKKNNVR